MKKPRTANKAAKKPSSKVPAKRGARKGSKGFLGDVLSFRWLKKAMVGKSREQSLDLLDRWILKKQTLGLLV